MSRDRALLFTLANSPLLWESVVHNHQRNGSRFLMPCFVAVCLAGAVFALVGFGS